MSRTPLVRRWCTCIFSMSSSRGRRPIGLCWGLIVTSEDSRAHHVEATACSFRRRGRRLRACCAVVVFVHRRRARPALCNSLTVDAQVHYRFCKMHFLSLEMHFRLPRRNAFSKSHYNASLRNALFEEWRNALFYGCLLMHYFTAFY